VVLFYFDSSAFVKLLVEEEGSDFAVDMWDGCDAAVSSRLVTPRCEPRWPPQDEATT
jgi:predicted nucleic acid-binding protein